jgi:hypothetical protein
MTADDRDKLQQILGLTAEESAALSDKQAALVAKVVNLLREIIYPANQPGEPLPLRIGARRWLDEATILFHGQQRPVKDMLTDEELAQFMLADLEYAAGG